MELHQVNIVEFAQDVTCFDGESGEYLWDTQRRRLVGSFNFMIFITSLKQDVEKEVSQFWGSG